MTRIPPSLNWLVRRRARLQGLIEASEHELARFAKIQDRIREFRLDLDALDRILRLHKIQIDPSTIPSVRTYADEKIRMRRWFSHGEFSRLLVEFFATNSLGSMSAGDLTQALLLEVCRRNPNDAIDHNEKWIFRELVRFRLRQLCEIGRIEHIRPAKEVGGASEQEWRLPRDGYKKGAAEGVNNIV